VYKGQGEKVGLACRANAVLVDIVKKVEKGELKADPKAVNELLRERLGLDQDRFMMTFQSRFGSAEWLKPYTDATVKALAERGVKNLAVVMPGFAADCLETLEEIAGAFHVLHKPEYEKVMDEVGCRWGVHISAGLAKAIESTETKLHVSRAMAELLNIDAIIKESGKDPSSFAGQIGDLAGKVAPDKKTLEYAQMFMIRSTKTASRPARGVVNVPSSPEEAWLFASDPDDKEYRTRMVRAVAADPERPTGDEVYQAVCLLAEGATPAEVIAAQMTQAQGHDDLPATADLFESTASAARAASADHGATLPATLPVLLAGACPPASHNGHTPSAGTVTNDR